jgi:hypothetical protein
VLRYLKNLALVVVLLFGVATSAFGLDPKATSDSPKQAAADPKQIPVPDPTSSSFSDIESSALEFVKVHHHDLVALLSLLRSMKETEYQSAIREINKVQRRLDVIENRDPDLFTIELDTWKTQSKIDFLMARAVASGKEINASDLRKLINKQIELQKKRFRHEQNVLSERQKALNENLEKLESNHEERIEQQIASLTKRVKAKIDKEKTLKAQSESKTPRDSKGK